MWDRSRRLRAGLPLEASKAGIPTSNEAGLGGKRKRESKGREGQEKREVEGRMQDEDGDEQYDGDDEDDEGEGECQAERERKRVCVERVGEQRMEVGVKQRDSKCGELPKWGSNQWQPILESAERREVRI
jgi:hypothetical protein